MSDEPEKIEKTAVELAREKIEVTVIKADDPVEESEAELEVEPETVEETIEANAETIEQSEKTEEELEAEKLEANTVAEKARIQKRIDREVSKRKVLEDEITELKRQLNVKKEAGEDVLTEADVDQLAEVKANAKQLKKEFDATCNRLADEAEKVDKDFLKNVKNLGEEIGPIPSLMIAALDDLENGGVVLAYLAKNPDEAEDFYKMNATKLGVHIERLSNKLKPKPVVKKLSNTPPPNTPVNSNGRVPNQLHDKMDDRTWIETRNAQRRAAGKF